jgi:hypothetical protein
MTKFASRADVGIAFGTLDQDMSESLTEGLAADPTMTTAPGYEPLFGVLADAYVQSAFGKGKERHGGGKPFDRQPIMEIGRMLGPDGQLFQVMKKAQEAGSMARRGEPGRAEHELLGVIVYAAAAVLLIREQKAR